MQFSISLAQNILVLDEPRELVSCVRIDYENKTNALNPSILHRSTRVIIDKEERYALRSTEVYMCLEQDVVFISELPPKTCRYIYSRPSFIRRGLYHTAFYIGG